jgi:DNA-binding MarR family transcriptional regulator
MTPGLSSGGSSDMVRDVAREAAGDEPAFETLAREVRRLFHQLRAAGEALHEGGILTVPQRAVLESLYRDGPQTVPALARARPVSRQHIQVLVDRLAELKLVRARPNPAHKRSPLIELTPEGRRRFAAMRRREHRALARSGLPVPDRDLRAAAEVLRALRDHLAREWPGAKSRAHRGPRALG